MDNPFCKTAVFLHDKSVIRAGNQKDFTDPFSHEFMKNLEG
jgi:hypothetical protein